MEKKFAQIYKNLLGLNDKFTIKHNKSNFIYCIETKEIFKTLKEAAEKYKISPKSIHSAIRANLKCAGYHWTYLDNNK